MPVHTQHQLILKLLFKEPKTLRQLTKHNILSPGKRISELIQMGLCINKNWTTWIDDNGATHKVMQYIYLPSQNELNSRGQMLINSVMEGSGCG